VGKPRKAIDKTAGNLLILIVEKREGSGKKIPMPRLTNFEKDSRCLITLTLRFLEEKGKKPNKSKMMR